MARSGPKPFHESHPEAIKRLTDSLRAGNFIDDACAAAGISDSAYYAWFRRAAEEESRVTAGGKPDPVEQGYVKLVDSIKKARADAINRNVALINTAAQNGTWQAAAWWLERTQPNKFGRRLATEVTGPDRGPVEVVTVTAQELDARIAALLGEDRDAGTE